MLSKRATVARRTPGARTYTLVASTEGLDGDRDTIRASGWKLDRYMENPVILLGHDRTSPPVARAVDVEVRDGQLVVEVEFPPEGVYPAADVARGMVESGFLRGVSVGFNGLRSRPNDHGGRDFLEQELLEVSLVAVPSNPRALLAAKAHGVWPTVFKSWFTGASLDKLSEADIEAFARPLPARPRRDVTEGEVRRLLGGDDVDGMLADLGTSKGELRSMIARSVREAVVQARTRYDGRLPD